MQQRKKLYHILKWSSYVLLIIIAYVLQTTTSLFVIFGVKPLLLVPLAVCIAMFEGEFAGAIFGAVAAGEERGGYRSVSQAIRAMGGTEKTVYYPVSQNAAVYDQLFREYRSLYEYFGCGGNEVMKRLKVLKNS